MFCSNICLVALVILIAKFLMLFTMTLNYNKIHKDFNKSLSDTQKKTYKNIVGERRRIYLVGYFTGLVLSVVAIIAKYSLTHENTLSIICLATIISTLTTYFFYILHPKSSYMIEVLKNDKQIKNWLKVYKSMQFRFHLCYLMGIIGTGLLHYSFC